MIKRTLAAISALTIAGTASADEVWTTDLGQYVYERDLPNGMAVLSFPADDTEDGPRGAAYVMGLAGVYEGRGRYDGVWVMPAVDGMEACPVAIANPETGEPEWIWGRFNMMFVDPDFPGTWVIEWATCFDEPTEILVGRPNTTR